MKRKPTLYLETSVISYLTARPTRDLVMAARQEMTREWWDEHRQHYEILISQVVLDEAAEGDSEAAARRLAMLNDFTVVPSAAEALDLAAEILKQKALPQNAWFDALHISIAAVARVHFLLTWNCRHINNPVLLEQIERTCHTAGWKCPVVCTPEQLNEIWRNI